MTSSLRTFEPGTRPPDFLGLILASFQRRDQRSATDPGMSPPEFVSSPALQLTRAPKQECRLPDGLNPFMGSNGSDSWW